MALAELRARLPHGDVGRIINSYVFPGHPDAQDQIREYRERIQSGAPDIHRAFIEAVSAMGIIRSYIYTDAITSQFNYDSEFLYGRPPGHFLYEDWVGEILSDLSISRSQLQGKLDQLARTLDRSD